MCDNMIIDDWRYFRSRAKNILKRCNNPSSEKDKTYKIKNIKCLLGKTTKEVALNLMKVEGYEFVFAIAETTLLLKKNGKLYSVSLTEVI